MEIETFTKTYTPALMELISAFHNMEVARLSKLLEQESHYVLNRIINDGEFERLSRMKMIIGCYPGCPICFKPDCTSDHK